MDCVCVRMHGRTKGCHDSYGGVHAFDVRKAERYQEGGKAEGMEKEEEVASGRRRIMTRSRIRQRVYKGLWVGDHGRVDGEIVLW